MSEDNFHLARCSRCATPKGEFDPIDVEIGRRLFACHFSSLGPETDEDVNAAFGAAARQIIEDVHASLGSL